MRTAFRLSCVVLTASTVLVRAASAQVIDSSRSTWAIALTVQQSPRGPARELSGGVAFHSIAPLVIDGIKYCYEGRISLDGPLLNAPWTAKDSVFLREKLHDLVDPSTRTLMSCPASRVIYLEVDPFTDHGGLRMSGSETADGQITGTWTQPNYAFSQTGTFRMQLTKSLRAP